MVFRLFLASLFFDFLIYLPLYHNFGIPWVVGMHQSGVIGYGLFTGISMFFSLVPLLFIIGLMVSYTFFENKRPMELKTVKNDKKKLVTVKAN